MTHHPSVDVDRNVSVTVTAMPPTKPAMPPQGWSGAEKRDIPPRYLMATSALHPMADISRDEPALALVHAETAHFWVGEWVAGFGYIGVHFPKASTRELTGEERETYGKKLVECGGVVRPITLGEVAR